MEEFSMKKFVTILAVFAMLASMLAVSVSAEQTCQEVTIPKFTAQPTFDGVVTVEEWGEPTVHMVTDGAATAEDDEIGSNEEYGLYNTFYWFLTESPEYDENLYYDLWLRWDEENLYVAAVVNDPDPFSLPKGGADIWNGDMLQFYVDVHGPSSIMTKQDPEWDYTTDEFLGARFNKPWLYEGSVFNGILGLVKGTTPTAWRAVAEWNMETEGGAQIGITTTPNEDGMTCTNVYEAAIPWAIIAAEKTGPTDLNTEFVPAAGDVYGMSFVVCCSDSAALTAWLQWGHGVCSVENNSTQPRGTRGGSQAVILGTDEIAPADEYDIYVETTAPVTEEEETDAPATGAATEATEGDATGDATAEKPETEADDKDEKPAADDKDDKKDEGDNTVIIIAAVAAAVIVIAIIIIVIAKKKKN